MSSDFEFDADQRKRIDVFIAEHESIHGVTTAAIGGRYTYSFTPTSLGMVQRVRCASCNKELDVSDYASW